MPLMSNLNIKIFKSRLYLTLDNQDMEKQFQTEVNKTILSQNIYYVAFILLIQIGFIIYESVYYNLYQGNSTFGVLITSYVTGGLYIVMLITALVFRKNLAVQRWINYCNFFLIVFVFGTIRNHLLNILALDAVMYTMLMLIEFMIRVGYLFLGSLNIKDSFIIITLNIISYWVYWPMFNDISKVYSRNIAFDILWVVESLVFYYFQLNKKSSFFFQRTAEDKCKWYTNIFDKMNTGFIHIKNNTINYMNNALVNSLLANNDNFKISPQKPSLNLVANLVNEESKKNIVLEYEQINTNKELQTEKHQVFNSYLNHSDYIINYITEGLRTENFNNDKNTSKDIIDRGVNPANSRETSVQNFMTKFKQEMIQTGQQDTFVSVGSKIIEKQDPACEIPYKTTYEIYCRYYTDKLDHLVNDHFEFIFNDVTKTEIVMEKKADTKYRALFLSKIAHEFKNPLICIAELAEQVSEITRKIPSYQSFAKDVPASSIKMKKSNEKIISTQSQFGNEATKKLPIIKALSNYLLMLVKDLDYFSNKDTVQTITEVDIKDIADYCEDIAIGLLANSNKMQDVKFNVSLYSKVLPKVMVDETKLKQILINMISNSVKFTNNGEIILNILWESGKVKFMITDTGQGIQESRIGSLFIPSIKGYENRSQGSGLGLTIIKELTQLIGTEVKFSSKVNEGSSFWFCVPIPKNSNMKLTNVTYTSEEENSHDPQDHFNQGNFSSKHVMKNHKSMFGMNKNKQQKNDEYQSIDKNESDFVIDLCKSNLEESTETVKLEKIHMTNPYSRDDISGTVNYNKIKYFFNHNIVINQQNSSYSNESNKFNIPKNVEKNSLNIIVVDDESITRQSTIRVIKSISLQKGLKTNILEADDGIECLYIVYKYLSKGHRINAIVCDETMNYMRGSTCAQIIRRLLVSKSLEYIPFFIVTAYEDDVTLNSLKNDCIDFIYSKPLTKNNSESILKKLTS